MNTQQQFVLERQNVYITEKAKNITQKKKCSKHSS